MKTLEKNGTKNWNLIQKNKNFMAYQISKIVIQIDTQQRDTLWDPYYRYHDPESEGDTFNYYIGSFPRLSSNPLQDIEYAISGKDRIENIKKCLIQHVIKNKCTGKEWYYNSNTGNLICPSKEKKMFLPTGFQKYIVEETNDYADVFNGGYIACREFLSFTVPESNHARLHWMTENDPNQNCRLCAKRIDRA